MTDKTYEDGLLEGRVRKLEDGHQLHDQRIEQNGRDIRKLILAMAVFFAGYAGIRGGPELLHLLSGG